MVSDTDSASDEDWDGFTPKRSGFVVPDRGESATYTPQRKISRTLYQRVYALFQIEVYRYLLGGLPLDSNKSILELIFAIMSCTHIFLSNGCVVLHRHWCAVLGYQLHDSGFGCTFAVGSFLVCHLRCHRPDCGRILRRVLCGYGWRLSRCQAARCGTGAMQYIWFVVNTMPLLLRFVLLFYLLTDRRLTCPQFFHAGIIACGFAVPITFSSNIYLIISLLWVVLFCGGAVMPSCSGIIVSIVPRNHRHISSSIAMVIFNLFGYFMSLVLSGLLMQV